MSNIVMVNRHLAQVLAPFLITWLAQSCKLNKKSWSKPPAFNYWGIFQTLWTLQKLGPGLDCGPVLITNFLKTATHNRQLGWKMNDVLASKLPFFAKLRWKFTETWIVEQQQHEFDVKHFLNDRRVINGHSKNFKRFRLIHRDRCQSGIIYNSLSLLSTHKRKVIIERSNVTRIEV